MQVPSLYELFLRMFNELLFSLVDFHYSGKGNSYLKFKDELNFCEKQLYRAYSLNLISEKNLYQLVDRLSLLVLLNNDLESIRDIKPNQRE